ncbi:MAG: DUF1043 family protein [Pseudomonadales bacterium]|nr:DUF1043 family protein [Pseudomonadales bacterium]
MDNIWLLAGISIAIGVIAGACGFWLIAGRDKNGAIGSKKQIRDLTEKLEVQQQQIDAHFVTTADLVNKLTLTYKEVYDHLSQGAQTLCDLDAATQVLDARKNVAKLIASDDARDINPDPTGPAKDYAPKAPDTTGTLSEGYGFTNDNRNT